MSPIIKRHIGTIKGEGRVFSYAFNICNWTGKDRYDLRVWDDELERPAKWGGVTMTEEEAKKLYELLKVEFE